ncbi:hypothetical protein [Piscinibacter gummiphilus]|uniref:DUF892 family protein n=1 Tax=Piscinibacter gummiphilus TaxID=946333 RepID=A0ABZ0CWU3_9BURK|nr:hypothetical protein [Piscinibacter gummiphilus]WOB09410.1 hypothetical protein RXV79_04945 [Piscinibacter gummiphilus]
MTATTTSGELTEVLGQLMQRAKPGQQQLLMATAERMAAARYRAWADNESGERRIALLACAAREEEVARRIEGLHTDADAVQAQIREQNPDLGTLAGEFFARFPVEEQYRLQAQAERLGAATWRSLAKRAEGGALRDVFLTCAALEEESAVVLESF